MKQKAKEANPINTESLNSDQSWSPLSWSEKPIKQLPPYPDTADLERAFNQLKSLPPLITSWEIEALKSKLAEVSQGKGFLLQGGDCAETFDACTAPKIVNMLKVMLQMSFILVHEMGTPIVRVGRIAGQYAKPRSKDSETIEGVEMLNYRGDLINSFEPNKGARTPDPQRLIMAYEKAALTLNFLRALADEGFADLQHPEQWELDFMQNNEYYKDYEAMVNSINRAINFMETITPNSFSTLHKVDIYTSHEALNLYYDSAQTRQVPRKPGFFNLSGHMVWLGNRTKQLDGAHVEYLSGIKNPIGIKVGPPFDMDETMSIIDKLNPNHEAGKIVLITRMGTDEVEKSLPKFIQKIKHSGHPVVWSCDPMHGNTFAT